MEGKIINLKERSKRKNQEAQNASAEYDSLLSQKELKYNNTGKINQKDIDELFEGLSRIAKTKIESISTNRSL